MAEIQDKTREWSERFGGILRLSAETQYPQIYKGAVGGLEHVISADNGAYYMEMWRDGGDQYYATTGAAIKPLPGLAKGVRLDEALDRFFVLMAKVEKAGGQRPARAQRGGQRPQRKAIPKKLKRLVGVRKNIVEKVDPEIGPSFSVGHRKPSDLSPESSMRKLAKRIIADAGRLAKQREPGQSFWVSQRGEGAQTKKPPVKKNVVALTGNQVGSGRVKPARSRKLDGHDVPGSPHKEHDPRVKADRTDQIRTRLYDIQMTYRRGTAPRKIREEAKRLVHALRQVERGGARKEDSAVEGRRMKDPVKPAKAPMPPKTYRSREGFSGRRMGDPRAPGASRSGAARGPGRFGKACVCDEVAKAVRAVDKPRPKPTTAPTEEERFRRGGPPSKPTQPMHPGQRMGGTLETTGGW